MEILSTLLAAGGGGITGAASGVATAYFQMQLQKAQIPLQMAEIQAERFIALTEEDISAKREDAATERAEIDAEIRGLEAAHQADKATYGNWFIDGLRGAVRPVITGWLVYLLSDMTLVLWDMQADNIDAEFWREMFRHLILTWTYLTTSAVMFWFGSRGGRAPQPQK